jgi:SAM-dependent methyltransferase
MLYCTKYLGCNPDNQFIYSADQNLKFIKCNDCGLIWRAPESLNLQKEYDKNYFTSKNYAKNKKHKIKKSEWLIGIAQNHHPKIESLFEVGSSIGNTLQAAKNLNINHLGTDISDFAVNYCKENGLNAEKLTIEQVIKNGNRFDLIFMQHVLEHFQNPFKTLSLCHQLLNKNGLILLLVPNSEYKWSHKKREKHRFYSRQGVGTEHFVYFNYNSISKVLEKTHFEVIQKNYPLFLKNNDSPEFFLNRFFRKNLSLCGGDQEIFLIAKKIEVL